MIPAFFSVSNAFLKEYPVILILIPEVWTEEIKFFVLHISYSTRLWFIHSFFGLNPDPQKHMDPCGSGSETLIG